MRRGESMESYESAQNELFASIAPYVGRIDLQALRKLEGAFQAEQHKRLFGLFCTNTKAVADVHGDIRGAHNFLMWVESKADKLTNSEG